MKKLLIIILCVISIQVIAQKDTEFAKKGIAQGKKGKFDKAIVSFDKALKINPKNFNALYYKGYVLEQQGKYSDAINYYSRGLIEQDKDFIYYRRGKCYFRNEQDSLAILDFNEALRRMPDNTEILMSRVSAYLRTKQYDKLLKDLNTHLRKNPNDYFSKANKSMALSKLDKHEEALEILFELEKEMPKEHMHRIYNGIASTYMELENLDQAKIYVEKSLSLVHNYDVAHITKAEIFLKLGDNITACQEYNFAKELGLDIDELDDETKAEFSTICKE